MFKLNSMPNSIKQSLFFACSLLFIAVIVWLTESNQSLFLMFNLLGVNQPDWLWANLTLMGDTLMAFTLLLMLASFKPAVFAPSVLLGIIGGILVHQLKAYFAVERPPAVLPPQEYHLIGHLLKHGSFPSGHSFSALSVATLFAWHCNKKWLTPIFLLLGFAAAFSRIMVAAHWPLDVLVGSALGILIALLCVFISQKLPVFSHKRLLNLYAGLIFLVVLSFPFYQSHYPNTLYLQITASLIALFMAVYFYWWPKLSGKEKELAQWRDI